MTRTHLTIGRIFLSLIFLGSAATKLADPSGTQAYMVSFGLPMTGVLFVGAVATELLGGIALILGWRTRVVAFALTGFVILATVIFHTSLGEQEQLLQFLKNVAILGGLVLVAGEGPGPYSVDTRNDEPPSEMMPGTSSR